jgi:hypothetical protein
LAPPPSPAQDPLYKHAISQITEVDPATSPWTYQSDSTLLLRRLYTLWVDHHQLDFLADVEYLLKLTNMYLDRVTDKIPEEHRVPDGERWIIGRCVALRARLLSVTGDGNEARAELRRSVLAGAAETATKVAHLVGSWHDRPADHPTGDVSQNRKWRSSLEDVLAETVEVMQGESTGRGPHSC